MMELCSIASGSSGNCIYVGTDDVHLLIDAGISKKKIENGLHEIGMKPEEIDGILVTHEHSDHVKGLGVMARKYGIPIYTTPGTMHAVLKDSKLGEIDEDLFSVIHPGMDFRIGEVTVNPVATSHDAAEPVSYIVRTKDRSAGVITDLGKYDRSIVDNLQNLDVLLIEANHDINMLQVGVYPYYLKQRILGDRGHLSNEACGQLLDEVLHDGMKKVFLGHLSKENNYPRLAYETVKLEITMGSSPYKGNDFPIEIAPRDGCSELVTV